jgi:hypothetical protein
MFTRRSFVGGLLGLFTAPKGSVPAEAVALPPAPARSEAGAGSTLSVCYSNIPAGESLDPTSGLICGVFEVAHQRPPAKDEEAAGNAGEGCGGC